MTAWGPELAVVGSGGVGVLVCTYIRIFGAALQKSLFCRECEDLIG